MKKSHNLIKMNSQRKVWCRYIILFFIFPQSFAKTNFFCEYKNLAWSDDPNFTPDKIDPFLCTHLIYNYVVPVETGAVDFTDTTLEDFREFTKIKQKNNELKTLLNVGNWDHVAAFYMISADAELRKIFAKNIVYTAVKYGFDGINLFWYDWDIKHGQFSEETKENFSLLLEQLRCATNHYNLLLSTLIGSVRTELPSYDIPRVSRLVDYMLLYINPCTDLYRTCQRDKTIHIRRTVYNFIKMGAPAQKIVLLLMRDCYVQKYELKDSSNTYIGAETNNLEEIQYRNVCPLGLSDYTHVWESRQSITYAYKGNSWISYETERSIDIKVNLGMLINLGGFFVKLQGDDYDNVCQNGNFPLSNYVKNAISKYRNIQRFIYTNTDFLTRLDNTKEIIHMRSYARKIDGNSICKFNEEHETECNKLFYCMNKGNNTFKTKQFMCPIGMIINKVKPVCDYWYAL